VPRTRISSAFILPHWFDLQKNRVTAGVSASVGEPAGLPKVFLFLNALRLILLVWAASLTRASPTTTGHSRRRLHMGLTSPLPTARTSLVRKILAARVYTTSRSDGTSLVHPSLIHIHRIASISSSNQNSVPPCISGTEYPVLRCIDINL